MQLPHFETRRHAGKHDFVENGCKKWRTPFVTHIFEILDIKNLYIPAITVFQAHLHAEKHNFVEKRM